MADDGDDGARRPPQAYDTVSPAGVGTTTTNQVSPGTIQEILDTGDGDLIDQAFDQMGIDDITAYLESLPSPSAFGVVSPAGVGSQASHTPSTEGARTPHRGSPRVSSGARSPPSWGSARLLAAAGAGGGGGGGDDGSGGSGGSRRSTPHGRPGRGRRQRPRRPQPSPSLPWTPPSPSQQATPPRTLNQADLQRRLRMLLQDQEQLARGREIANVIMTNSIVTSYKQGGRPSVQGTSSCYSS